MPRLAILVCLAAVLSALAPSPASGQAERLYAAVTLTSDYRLQGVSSSDNGPALQGYVHLWRPDGWYAGVFASTVAYEGAESADVEVDGYVGRSFELSHGRRISAEVMYSAFPDNRTPGPTFDFLQIKLAGRRALGPATGGLSLAYTPEASYGAGQAWLLEGEAQRAVAADVMLKGRLGRRWAKLRPDRTFWSLGAAWTRGAITLEARYEDSDLSRRTCGFNPDICGAALVVSITRALRPPGL